MSSEQPLKTAKTDDAYGRALDLNIRAFEAQPVEWKEKLRGQFVLFHQGKFVDAFASFDNAARTAIKQFGRDCYLIRRVGVSFFRSSNGPSHKLSVALYWRVSIVPLRGRGSLAPLH